MSNDLFSYCWRSSKNLVFGLILSNLFHFAFSNPTLFAMASFVLYCLFWTKRRWRARELDREEVSRIKDSTYERLQNLETGFPANMLRDDILDELEPSDEKRKMYLKKRIWPKIVKQIEADTRIQQKMKPVAGVPTEHWTFVSPLPKEKRGRGSERSRSRSRSRSPSRSRSIGRESHGLDANSNLDGGNEGKSGDNNNVGKNCQDKGIRVHASTPPLRRARLY